MCASCQRRHCDRLGCPFAPCVASSRSRTGPEPVGNLCRRAPTCWSWRGRGIALVDPLVCKGNEGEVGSTGEFVDLNSATGIAWRAAVLPSLELLDGQTVAPGETTVRVSVHQAEMGKTTQPEDGAPVSANVQAVVKWTRPQSWLQQ